MGLLCGRTAFESANVMTYKQWFQLVVSVDNTDSPEKHECRDENLEWGPKRWVRSLLVRSCEAEVWRYREASRKSWPLTWWLNREILPRMTYFIGRNRETCFWQMGERKPRRLRTCSYLLGLELWEMWVKAKTGDFVKAYLRQLGHKVWILSISLQWWWPLRTMTLNPNKPIFL